MKTLASVVDEAMKCHAVLVRNSASEAAAHILSLVSEVQDVSSFEKKRRLLELASCCHPKAWGDVYVRDLSWADWQNYLSRLEAQALAVAAKIEKNETA